MKKIYSKYFEFFLGNGISAKEKAIMQFASASASASAIPHNTVDEHENVKKAEIIICGLLAEHNLSLLTIRPSF